MSGVGNLEFFSVSRVFESLAQTLEIASHSYEGIAGGKKDTDNGRSRKHQGKSKFHVSKVIPPLPADKSLFLGTFLPAVSIHEPTIHTRFR